MSKKINRWPACRNVIEIREIAYGNMVEMDQGRVDAECLGNCGVEANEIKVWHEQICQGDVPVQLCV